MNLEDKCPVCNTNGKNWEREKNIFSCPQCYSIYSEFGIVMESQKQFPDFWN